MKIVCISSEQLIQTVTMTQAIQAVREAYIALSSGEAVMPQRTQISVAAEDGIALFMPAYLPRTGSLGAKIVSVFPKNPDRELPTINALAVILDSRTGVGRVFRNRLHQIDEFVDTFAFKFLDHITHPKPRLGRRRLVAYGCQPARSVPQSRIASHSQKSRG